MPYYLMNGPDGASVVVLKTPNAIVSFGEDVDNTDYQEYLSWLAEGNAPEPWPPAE